MQISCLGDGMVIKIPTLVLKRFNLKEKYIQVQSSDVFRLELEGVNLRLDKTLSNQASMKPQHMNGQVHQYFLSPGVTRQVP